MGRDAAAVLGLPGLVVGIALGAGLTSELLSGGGAWGRAGVLALLLPVFVFPAVVLALVLAFVLGVRLLVAGNRRVVVLVVLILNAAFSSLLAWAIWATSHRSVTPAPGSAVVERRG